MNLVIGSMRKENLEKKKQEKKEKIHFLENVIGGGSGAC